MVTGDNICKLIEKLQSIAKSNYPGFGITGINYVGDRDDKLEEYLDPRLFDQEYQDDCH